jgi:hypothetical protein
MSFKQFSEATQQTIYEMIELSIAKVQGGLMPEARL